MQKIVKKFDNYLSQMLNHFSQILNKESRFDGRLIVIGSLIGLVSLVFLSTNTYNEFWHRLGVPSKFPPFADLREVTSAFECTRQGYDTLLQNPCNSYSGGPLPYPRIWMRLASLGFDQSHTVILASIFITLFYIAIWFFLGRLNLAEGCIYSLFICSPPVFFLIERGNVDIIIFLMLSISLFILARITNLYARSLAYLLILFASILKLSPIFGIVVALQEKKKTALTILLVIPLMFLIYQLLHLDELKATSAFFGSSGPSRLYENKYIPELSIWYAHGYQVIFNKIGLIFYYNFYDFLSNKRTFVLFMLDMISLLIATGIAVYFIYLSLCQLKKWIKNPFNNEQNMHISIQNAKLIDGFRMTSGLYIGTFVLGWVYDYKLVFLIFAIPQLSAWIKEKKLGLLPAFTLILILITIYLTPFSTRFYIPFFYDEIANWFIFGCLIYAFLYSLPDWLRSDTHQVFGKVFGKLIHR